MGGSNRSGTTRRRLADRRKTLKPYLPFVQTSKSNRMEASGTVDVRESIPLHESTRTLPYLSLQSPSRKETQRLLLSLFSHIIKFTSRIASLTRQLSPGFQPSGFFFNFAENTPNGKGLSLFGLSNFCRFLRVDFSFITIYRIMNHLSGFTLADFSQVISVSTKPRSGHLFGQSHSDLSSKIFIELQEFENLFHSSRHTRDRRRRKTLADWRALALTQSSDYATTRQIVVEFGRKLEAMAAVVSELKRCEEGRIFECLAEFRTDSGEISQNLLSEKNLDSVESEARQGGRG